MRGLMNCSNSTSNGGLLMGNMLTMRPDLFGAIVCQVPLLDMQRYHKLLAGASWVDEPVVVDGNLISSRTPRDLAPLAAAVVKFLDEHG